MHRNYLLSGLLAAMLATSAHAAERGGITFPDTTKMGDSELALNGTGLRTAFLGIQVYAAGLYLEHRSSDPKEILASPEKKLVVIHMLRDVSAERARSAWKEDLENNCKKPCPVSPAKMAEFVSKVQGAKNGDTINLAFTGSSLDMSVNGVTMDSTTEPALVRAALGAFIGDEPASASVKRQLLNMKDD